MNPSIREDNKQFEITKARSQESDDDPETERKSMQTGSTAASCVEIEFEELFRFAEIKDQKEQMMGLIEYYKSNKLRYVRHELGKINELPLSEREKINKSINELQFCINQIIQREKLKVSKNICFIQFQNVLNYVLIPFRGIKRSLMPKDLFTIILSGILPNLGSGIDYFTGKNGMTQLFTILIPILYIVIIAITRAL